MGAYDQGAMRGHQGLQDRVFEPLPLGAILPTGWLRDQLRIQAEGMAGRLDEFWPDVARSRWIGGDAEGWERGPYWLDGTVPLAYLLDDDRLKTKVQHWVEQILTHQDDEGWLGPVLDSRYSYPYDAWPRFVVLKALTQYYEATSDARVLATMQAFLRKLDEVLDVRPLRSWAYYRWADLVVSIHWLHARVDDSQRAFLLRLAEKLEQQGFDWRAHFERFPYHDRSRREECALRSHGPNNSMGIKTPAIWYRQSGNAADRDVVSEMIATLDRYHGQATGMFTCDEHLAGLNPSQGSELCAVVEYMYSLETSIPATGDPALADLLERLAFNALPATLTPDMWARQYDQQVNQVQCVVTEDRIYTSNHADSNIFGLEPHFGCCTPNHAQGWPKFATHMWMRSSDDGIAAVAYAPSIARVEIKGVPVEIELATEYPFAGDLRFTVRTGRPVTFPLRLRIPGWAEGAELRMGDGVPTPVEPGRFHLIQQEWNGETSFVLQLPLAVRIERRFNNSVAIHRGPLLFGLKIGEEFRQIGGELPHADWEVYPTTPWNYALEIDDKEPERSVSFTTRPVGKLPFSPEGAPVSAQISGRRVLQWGFEHNAAAQVPPSPVTSEEPRENLTLIPYGSTNLRIAEFPALELEQAMEWIRSGTAG